MILSVYILFLITRLISRFQKFSTKRIDTWKNHFSRPQLKQKEADFWTDDVAQKSSKRMTKTHIMSLESKSFVTFSPYLDMRLSVIWTFYCSISWTSFHIFFIFFKDMHIFSKCLLKKSIWGFFLSYVAKSKTYMFCNHI